MIKGALSGLLLSFIVGQANAQVVRSGADIKTACSPIVMAFVASSKKMIVSSESWVSYASKMYFSSATTIEEAQKEGFSADVVVEGVPLSLIWSRDDSKRTKARETWLKYVNRTASQKDFLEISDVKTDPQAAEVYNKCVANLSGREPLMCWFSEPTNRAHATFNVVLQPAFQLQPQKVVEAVLSNGFVVGPEVEGLRGSKDKNVLKKVAELDKAIDVVESGKKASSIPSLGKSKMNFPLPVNAGVFTFQTYRLDPGATISGSIRLQNGMGCSSSMDPAATVVAKVRIWPEARNWSRATSTYNFDDTVGCGANHTETRDFCYPNSQAIIVSAAPQPPKSANCGSRMLGTAIKIPAANCFRASAHMEGCGFDWTRSCKGRGWLDQDIHATVDVPGDARPLPIMELQDKRTSYVERVRYDYDQLLPPDAIIDRWKYVVEMKFSYAVGRDIIFTLSDDASESRGCVSKGSGPGERSGYVQIACELPTDLFQKNLNAIKPVAVDIKTLPNQYFVLHNPETSKSAAQAEPSAQRVISNSLDVSTIGKISHGLGRSAIEILNGSPTPAAGAPAATSFRPRMRVISP